MNNNLLSFEEFVDRIKRDIKAFLPLEFSSAEINVSESRKINDSYLGMTILKEGQHISPAIDLDTMYRAYQESGEITPIFHKIAEIAQTSPDGMSLDAIENYEKAKENLFIRVSNAETNKDLMDNVPHETIGDLAVTYHIMVNHDGESMGSTMITNALLDTYGISEEQLKADAMENSAKILAPSLESMNNVMARMFGLDFPVAGRVPFEKAVEDFNFREEGMFVLTNSAAVNGAAVMFYPEVMEQLGDHAGVDLFIIPSSVHETILVPDDGVMKRTELESMIRDINANEVSPKDRLSDTLYHYDSKDHKLERAIDFEERKEMEHSIGRKVERSSIRDKLKSAEARVNEQMAPSRPARAQAIE